MDEGIKIRFPNVNWKSITSLRNELSHNYRGIDEDLIWDIVQNYLKDLKEVCIEIFNQLVGNTEVKDKIDEILDPSYYSHIQYLKK